MRDGYLLTLCFFPYLVYGSDDQKLRSLNVIVTSVTSNSVSFRRISYSLPREDYNRVDIRLIGQCDGIYFNEICPCTHEVQEQLGKNGPSWTFAGLRPNFEYNATLTMANYSSIIASDTFQFKTKSDVGLLFKDIVVAAFTNRSIEVVVSNLTCAKQSGEFDLVIWVEGTTIPVKNITFVELEHVQQVKVLLEGDLFPGNSYRVCVQVQQKSAIKKYCQSISIPETAPFEPPILVPYPDGTQSIIGYYIQAPTHYQFMKIKEYQIQVLAKCAVLDLNCGQNKCEFQKHSEWNIQFQYANMYLPLDNLNLSQGTKCLMNVWAKNDWGVGEVPGSSEFQTESSIHKVEPKFILSEGEDYVRVSIHPICPYLEHDHFEIVMNRKRGFVIYWQHINQTNLAYQANSTKNALSHTFANLEVGNQYQVCVRAKKRSDSSKESCKEVKLQCVPLEPATQSLAQVPWSLDQIFNPFTTVRLFIPGNTFNGYGTGIRQYVIHCPAQYHWGHHAQDDDIYWNTDSFVEVDLEKPDHSVKLAITAIACQNNQTTKFTSVQTEPIPDFDPKAKMSQESGQIVVEFEEDIRVILYLSNVTTYQIGTVNLSLPQVFNLNDIVKNQNTILGRLTFPVDPKTHEYLFVRRIEKAPVETFYFTSQNMGNPTWMFIGWAAFALILIILSVFVLYKKVMKPWLLQSLKQRMTSVINPADLIPKEVNRPITLDELARRSSKIKSHQAEFDLINQIDIAKNGSLPCSDAILWGGGSPSMNRYKNILPFNGTRVALKTPIQSCDYINASWIQDMALKRRYIAAQGPLDHTIEHFWQMVLDYNVKLIMMLTKTKENGPLMGQMIQKCARYWPSKEGSSSTHGQIKITLEKLENISGRLGLIKRSLTVAARGKSVEVIQYQLTSWPDHGVPKDTAVLLELQKILGRFMKKCPSMPVLIHCSAGVGRTGTLIAMNELIFELERGAQQVDIAKFVLQMRQNRTNMVQHAIQYQYIYDCLAEFAVVTKENGTEGDAYYSYDENEYDYYYD